MKSDDCYGFCLHSVNRTATANLEAMKTKTPHSNLETFLNCTTPKIPIWDLSTDWNQSDKDKIDCYNLGKLWDCYDEWSAYGVGAPIVDGSDTVVQYYTPYLSAIQIYTTRTPSLRQASEDCDGEFELKSWTSESSDPKLSRSSSSNSEKISDLEELDLGLEDHWLVNDHLTYLYFEYFEVDGPFKRVPLKDKIDELSLKNPGLKAFNSSDLSPASWMSIAWYPIYHIPPQRNAKELYASFLTYHTLSSFQENITGNYINNGDVHLTGRGRRELRREGIHDNISLPPFGLAAYRMQSKIWLNPETSDHKRLSDLKSAADSWLKQLRVQHHDFNFFITHPG